MKLLSTLLILNIMPSISNQESNIQTIYFGGGCFWCVEAVFEDIKGVTDATSGYAGGDSKNPSYNQVSSGQTKHAEVCKITYDASKIKLQNLLEIFFLTHDPTTLNRQGNDIGYHYRSIVLFNNNKEEEIIKKYIVEANKNLYENNIVTEVKKFENFYKAEQYHQGYYKLNTQQPYCNAVITPKILKARKKLSKYY
jgi:methionine-S-sulfoxide reductase